MENITHRSEETQDCSKGQQQAPSPNNADLGSKIENTAALLKVIEEEEKD
jgi:hypothetical protein